MSNEEKCGDKDCFYCYHETEDCVWYQADGTPRYHPDFRYIGKRWVTVDGKRVMVDD